jgi:hypothetical protein
MSHRSFCSVSLTQIISYVHPWLRHFQVRQPAIFIKNKERRSVQISGRPSLEKLNNDVRCLRFSRCGMWRRVIWCLCTNVSEETQLTMKMEATDSYETLILTYQITRRPIILLSLVFQIGRALAQAVSPWLPTTTARLRVRTACGVCGGQSGTGARFLRVLRFPLPIIIPPISPSS